jgi:hypothetical protein
LIVEPEKIKPVAFTLVIVIFGIGRLQSLQPPCCSCRTMRISSLTTTA